MTAQELAAWEADETKQLSAFYVALGLFTHKFGALELQLARLHAHIMQADDFQAFVDEIGVQTVGIRVAKIARSAARRRPMGAKIEARFRYFENHIVPLRNRIMHDTMIPEDDRVRLVALDRYDPGVKEDVRPKERPELSVTLDEIRSVTHWLDGFFHDVSNAAEAIWQSDNELEIERPRSDAEAEFKVSWKAEKRKAPVCENCGAKV